MSKYGEPWWVAQDPLSTEMMHETRSSLNMPKSKHDIHLISDCDGIHVAEGGCHDKSLERLERAIACVNAMAGIPDPAKFVEAAKNLWNEAKDTVQLWDLDEHPEGESDVLIPRSLWMALRDAIADLPPKPEAD